MGSKIEVQAGIIDGLDHLGVKIAFMSDACTSISKLEYALDADAAFGMQLVFDEINDQVAVIKKEVTEMFCEEIKTEKVSN
jgi:hypothetical protein